MKLRHGLQVIDCDCVEVPGGDLVCVRFARPRRVCSDACWNGGLHAAALAVANHRMKPESVASTAEFQKYCGSLLEQHRLPASTILQLTAARLPGGAGVEDGGGFPVTALITAGVSHNAVCAGDAAGYDETAAGEYRDWQPGTINSMVFVDADLSAEALLHVFTVVAECKADELIRRGVRSHVSDAVATGTGTDTTTIVCNPFSKQKRTTSSTHSRLGMAIARALRPALKEVLEADLTGQAAAAEGR